MVVSISNVEFDILWFEHFSKHQRRKQNACHLRISCLLWREMWLQPMQHIRSTHHCLFSLNWKKSVHLKSDVLSSRIQNKYSLTCFVFRPLDFTVTKPHLSTHLIGSILWHFAGLQALTNHCRRYCPNISHKSTNRNTPAIYIRFLSSVLTMRSAAFRIFPNGI